MVFGVIVGLGCSGLAVVCGLAVGLVVFDSVVVALGLWLCLDCWLFRCCGHGSIVGVVDCVMLRCLCWLFGFAVAVLRLCYSNGLLAVDLHMLVAL